MTFFYKFWKKARVYYTLSISRGGARPPGPPPLDSPLKLQPYRFIFIHKHGVFGENEEKGSEGISVSLNRLKH